MRGSTFCSALRIFANQQRAKVKHFLIGNVLLGDDECSACCCCRCCCHCCRCCALWCVAHCCLLARHLFHAHNYLSRLTRHFRHRAHCRAWKLKIARIANHFKRERGRKRASLVTHELHE